jgi:hypothetical protein
VERVSVVRRVCQLGECALAITISGVAPSAGDAASVSAPARSSASPTGRLPTPARDNVSHAQHHRQSSPPRVHSSARSVCLCTPPNTHALAGTKWAVNQVRSHSRAASHSAVSPSPLRASINSVPAPPPASSDSTRLAARLASSAPRLSAARCNAETEAADEVAPSSSTGAGATEGVISHLHEVFSHHPVCQSAPASTALPGTRAYSPHPGTPAPNTRGRRQARDAQEGLAAQQQQQQKKQPRRSRRRPCHERAPRPAPVRAAPGQLPASLDNVCLADTYAAVWLRNSAQAWEGRPASQRSLVHPLPSRECTPALFPGVNRIFLGEAGEKFHFLLLRQLNSPNCSSDLRSPTEMLEVASCTTVCR